MESNEKVVDYSCTVHTTLSPEGIFCRQVVVITTLMGETDDTFLLQQHEQLLASRNEAFISPQISPCLIRCDVLNSKVLSSNCIWQLIALAIAHNVWGSLWDTFRQQLKKYVTPSWYWEFYLVVFDVWWGYCLLPYTVYSFAVCIDCRKLLQEQIFMWSFKRFNATCPSP